MSTVLENIKSSSKKTTQILSLILSILSTSTFTEKAAATENEQNQIEWALQATENLDPMYVLEKRFVPKESKKERAESFFSTQELNVLTWNIYHEARGEDKLGQIAVLLSSLERMKSKDYGSTAEEVVFQDWQYSWSHDFKKFDNKNSRVKTYINIRTLVEKFLNDKDGKKINFEEKTLSVKGYLEKIIGKKIPDRLTHYHKLGMLDGMTSEEIRKKGISESTENRIKRIEKHEDTNPNIVVIGSHIFYTQALANSPE